MKPWLFHSHAYFDHSEPARVAEARAFMALIESRYPVASHVNVTSFIPGPAGPHPRGSFEVRFTREAFADFVPWLMLARPEPLDILIHPVTNSHVLDHTARAFWLGTPLAINTGVLEAADARR